MGPVYAVERSARRAPEQFLVVQLVREKQGGHTFRMRTLQKSSPSSMPAVMLLGVAMASLLACGAAVTAPSNRATAQGSSVQGSQDAAKDCRSSPFGDLPRTTVGSQSRLEVSGSQNSDLPGVAMTVTEESGSMISATTVVLRARNGEPDTQVSFETRLDRMVTVHRVRNDMLGKSQSERRRAVADAAFTLTCVKPDPSLERLLERGHALRWYEGWPELPTNYTLQVEESGARATEWIEYLGANHRRRGRQNDANELQLLDKTAHLELRASAHGAVIVNIETKHYAWIYIYPGGSKLRSPSVRAGTLAEGQAILSLNQPEFEHEETEVRIDLATGAVALLP
jgi:hypothetical protein